MQFHKIFRPYVISFSLLIFCVIGFLLLSKFEDRQAIKNLDFACTVLLQRRMPVIERIGGDRVWEWVAASVSPSMSILLSIALGIFLLVRLRVSKKSIFIVSLIGIGLSFTVVGEVYGKVFVRHTPPPFFMLKNPSVTYPTYHITEINSYPSGHAARVVYLAAIWWYSISILFSGFLAKKRHVHMFLIFFCVVWVALVCIAKVYLGHHWLSDILGGAALGGISAAIFIIVLKQLRIGHLGKKV